MSDQNQTVTETQHGEENKLITKGRSPIRAKNPPEPVTPSDADVLRLSADVQRLSQTVNKLLKKNALYRDTMKWYANGGSDTGDRARQVLELVKK